MAWEFLAGAAAFVLGSGLIGRCFSTLKQSSGAAGARSAHQAATAEPPRFAPCDRAIPPQTAVAGYAANGVTSATVATQSRIKPQPRLVGRPHKPTILLSTSHTGRRIAARRAPA